MQGKLSRVPFVPPLGYAAWREAMPVPAGRSSSPGKRSPLPKPSTKPSPRSASPSRPNARSKSPSKPRGSAAAAKQPLAAPTAASRTQLVLQLAVFLDLLGVMLVVPNLIHRFRELGISTANYGVVSSVYSASQARPPTRPHTSPHGHTPEAAIRGHSSEACGHSEPDSPPPQIVGGHRLPR